MCDNQNCTRNLKLMHIKWNLTLNTDYSCYFQRSLRLCNLTMLCEGNIWRLVYAFPKKNQAPSAERKKISETQNVLVDRLWCKFHLLLNCSFNSLLSGCKGLITEEIFGYFITDTVPSSQWGLWYQSLCSLAYKSSEIEQEWMNSVCVCAPLHCCNCTLGGRLMKISCCSKALTIPTITSDAKRVLLKADCL